MKKYIITIGILIAVYLIITIGLNLQSSEYELTYKWTDNNAVETITISKDNLYLFKQDQKNGYIKIINLEEVR